MATPILPKAQSAIADNGLRGKDRIEVVPTGVWLDFFRDLLGRVNDDEALAAEIAAIILRLETLEGAEIIGTQSVQVFGSLSAGLVNLLLRGDEPTPSPLFYYGTDPVGNKGFQPAASLVEYMIDENGDYLVDENGDFLISADITADLFAIVATTTGLLAHTGVGTWETRALTEGVGIDITDGDGVAGNPTIAHEDTSSVANLISDNSGTVVLQDLTLTFDTFGHVLTATVGTVDVASALAGTFQPLDATLTALAGQNWAANALPIGSGADTVAQISFAANTFPARASTGDLVAKPITDFGLSLVDDATAADARTTLGIPTLDHGTYTPTLTGVANVDSTTPQQFQYMRVGNTVTVSGRIEVDATAAGSTLTQVGISLPIASNLAATTNLAGAGGAGTTPYAPALIIGDTANDRATFAYYSTSTTSVACLLTFTYLVI